MIEYDELIWLLIVVLIGTVIYHFVSTKNPYIDWLWNFMGFNNKVLGRIFFLVSFLLIVFWLVDKWNNNIASNHIVNLMRDIYLDDLNLESWIYIFLIFCLFGILVLGGIYLISIIIKWIIDRYNKNKKEEKR